MSRSEIPSHFRQHILEQAEQAYPHECCGLILGYKEKSEAYSRVRPCRNAQDDFHARFPDVFKRSAEAAYFMDPVELLAIQKEIRRQQEEIRIIYHSHIDAAAVFSQEDKAMAVADGEPLYPGVDYLVVSVMQGRARDWFYYGWNKEQKVFLKK